MKDIRLNALANTLVRLLNIFFPLITTLSILLNGV